MSDLRRLAEPLNIGGVEIRNRVFLAPMSGITDEPFRLRAYRHGAGLVVSEMVASGELAKGRQGTRHPYPPFRPACPHGAACRPRGPSHGRGRAHRGGRGRRHHRHQHGLSGQEGDRRLFRLGADARPRPRGLADRRGDRRRRRAGHGEDAARLGRGDAQRAAACPPRRAVGREDGDGPWPHALPVLPGQGRLAGDRPHQAGGLDPGRCQWRCRHAGRRRRNPREFRRRRRDDRPRPLRRAVDGRRDRAGRGRTMRPRRQPGRTGRLRRRALPGHAVALRRRKRPAGKRASISAGISIATRRSARPRRARPF